MVDNTKIIILTTDEDIIRQFSLNKSANTQTIDLDNNSEQNLPKQNTTDDSINLSFLAELSTLNSSNDQMYKRALDSTNSISSKPVKTPRKSIDMICAICGDKAIGYNYNALSCDSCKAFFRRNANKNLESLICFTGDGHCSVAHDMNPKCLKCRLERCFAAGMRKDFMHTGKNKTQKKNILEQPLSNTEDFSLGSDELDRLLNDINEHNDNIHLNLLDDTLSIEDMITIENVRSASLSAFEKDLTKRPSYDCSDSTSAVILFSNLADGGALKFIKFFRQINEFEELDANDRFVLIKYNLFAVYPILKCFFSKRESGSGTDVNNEEKAKIHRFFRLCCGSDSACQTYMNVVFLLMEAIQQDETILSLLLVVLMFSQGLSMNEDEPILKDPLQVNRAQSHYVQLLWNYMIYKWNAIEVEKRFTLLLSIILHMQKVSKMLRDIFHAQIVTSNVVDQIAPLMQTVLNIS